MKTISRPLCLLLVVLLALTGCVNWLGGDSPENYASLRERVQTDATTELPSINAELQGEVVEFYGLQVGHGAGLGIVLVGYEVHARIKTKTVDTPTLLRIARDAGYQHGLSSTANNVFGQRPTDADQLELVTLKDAVDDADLEIIWSEPNTQLKLTSEEFNELGQKYNYGWREKLEAP